MKKLMLIFFSILGSLTQSYSQSCLPDGITFSAQEQIDSFQTSYPDCTEIEGGVIINGVDITNLNGLSILTSIGELLSIWGNNALTSLTGLEGLKTIGGPLYIYHNAALTSLTGLEGLTSTGGTLFIYHNDALTSLTGLEGLKSIGGGFQISENASLTSLTGLEGLTSIGESINIWYSAALTSLTGLEGLTSIGGVLEIYHSDALTSLTGLDNIEEESITDLLIYNNASLSTCEIQSVCDYLVEPNGTIEIRNNAPGCNSQEEVKVACDGVSVGEFNKSVILKVHPNPFTTSTTIEYQLDHPLEVTLSIFNHLGTQVELIRQNQQQGKQQLTWNAEGIPAGMYFYTLTAGDQVATGKLLKID